MRLTTTLGSFRLNRFPLRQRETLQAWDAADEYLLRHVGDNNLLDLGDGARPILLINDQFGALATAFNSKVVCCWGDSWVAHQGTLENFRRNRLANVPQCLPSTETLTGSFGLVLIKIPRSLALLEHQLAGLAAHIDTATVVIAAGMVKSIHNSTLALFEKYLGPTTTSLASKKARLIFPTLQALAGPTLASPYPDRYLWESAGIELLNHANVFSRDQLDLGARAMLTVIGQLPSSAHIVDLACGNGVLGIAAALSQAQAKISFVDESYMAIASAMANWQTAIQAAGITPPVAEFLVHDCLAGLNLAAVDLIICNPPFHEGHAIGDHIAWRMFKQSFDRLQVGGELWIVGNRHLHYDAKLKQIFGNCAEQHSNAKFVVLSAKKNLN